jgi:hypothetical protein
VRGRGAELLRVSLLLSLRELEGLADCLGMLQLRGLLGGCTPGLVLLELLARVRLRLRRRRELLLLVLDILLRMVVLQRGSLGSLGTLLLLRLVVDGLGLRGSVQLRVRQQRAGHVLRVEGLVLALVLRWRVVWLIALVLLGGLLLLLLRLQALALVVIRRVLRYPTLCPVAPLSAYPVERGPILLLLLLLLLLGVSRELLLLGVLWVVLRRHLGLVALVLQERVEIVLVLLGGDGQMRARALVPLLRRVQALLLVQLLLEPGVALPDGRAAVDAVLARLLARVLVLPVPCEVGGDAAAERLLGGLGHGRRRLWLLLVCAVAALVSGGRAGLLRRVALGLVEVRAEAMRARGARGIWLLRVLGGRDALCDALLAVCLEALHALVVYCQRWLVSRTHALGGPNQPLTHLTGSATTGLKSGRRSGASDSYSSWKRAKAWQVGGRATLLR